MESREGGGAEVGGKCVGLLSSRPVYLVRAGTEEIGGKVAATRRQNGGEVVENRRRRDVGGPMEPPVDLAERPRGQARLVSFSMEVRTCSGEPRR